MQHHRTPRADQLPAAQLLSALKHLDPTGQEGMARILLCGLKHVGWLNRAMQFAIAQHLDEQRALDKWIEEEAAKDIARLDPYAVSKEGDGAYWTQQ